MSQAKRGYPIWCWLLAAAALLLSTPAQADDDAAKRAALLAGYPGLFTFEGNDLVFPNGTHIVWDDGKVRSAQQLIDAPDVEDMFHYLYPLADRGELTPALDFDPGRIRNEAFFKQIYGASAKAVGAHIVSAQWVGSKQQVTKLFGIDKRLAAVAASLSGPLRDYGRNPGGGFVWRVIAGTSLLSVHSFGAAFDINVDYSDYWRWAKGNNGTVTYKNRIPLAIVKLFEAEGFIWGGRWYHYDTMHFEYRPELLAYAKTH